MAFDIPRDVILPVDRVAVRLSPAPHPFEAENGTAIADGWQREIAANPALFDGTVVLLSELAYRDRQLVGICHAVRFSTFMHWRRNKVGSGAEHAFAHAVLSGSEGALVAIRMGPHTANPGRVYFAAGSFEPVDFPGGMVDVDANMIREVGEETGLDVSNAVRDAGYHILSGERGTVIFRRYRMPQTADALAEAVRRHVEVDPDPEIAGPVIIRTPREPQDGLMPYMPALIEWHFSGQT